MSDLNDSDEDLKKKGSSFDISLYLEDFNDDSQELLKREMRKMNGEDVPIKVKKDKMSRQLEKELSTNEHTHRQKMLSRIVRRVYEKTDLAY